MVQLHETSSHPAIRSPFIWFMAVLDVVRHSLELRAQRLQIVDELTALSDRDLAELGIARSDIGRIARAHVEGQ